MSSIQISLKSETMQHLSSKSTYLLCLALVLSSVRADFKVLVITEADQPDMFQSFAAGVKTVEDANTNVKIDELQNLVINRTEDEFQLNETCSNVLQGGAVDFSLILDLSWGGWTALKELADRAGFPYVRLDAANHQFVQAADDYLRDREAIDAALIFESESALDQSLYYLIGNSYIRIIVINMAEDGAFKRLAKMRPSPSYYVAHGSSAGLSKIFEEAKKEKLLRRDARWNFILHSLSEDAKSEVDFVDSGVQVTVIKSAPKNCGNVLASGKARSLCESESPGALMVERASELISQTFAALKQSGKPEMSTMTCYSDNADKTFATDFYAQLKSTVSSTEYIFKEGEESNNLLTCPLELNVLARNKTSEIQMGIWTDPESFVKASGYSHKEIPRYFRIGTVPTKPWAYKKLDKNGKAMLDEEGDPILEGYCVEMVEELSKKMFFDYKLILPTDGSEDYGKKSEDGMRWSGVIGDLVHGEIDIAVAGMTMTSEREEVVDFVAPYFDQSGISIIIRKPVRARSLFKFMEVLRVEVWMAILAALVVTALMLWFLDRYSPYSAQNNKEAHPYPCRVFTLKESFWFALTSFTPQGGGEAPKSLSGRVLVAAYWLFVVLMLATFTANLAAFLTVERMQTTVQGLEELAQQSKINYTVMDNSPYFEYFKNMANAEEDLYRVWKDLTLSSNADQSKYRVWDYPIKEQYTHIFKTIKASGMVDNAEEGFKRVLDDEDGTFAFIHDAAEVKYEYYNNCNFTEVGEPFAEQPYAVAVQQGSHLQEEISKVILELQKDRYFETLSSKYWNSTLRSLCPTLDDSEGITLRSLGGVFIATLVGLGIAMIVLAFEVYFHKKAEKNSVQDISISAEKRRQQAAHTKGIIQVGSRQVPYDVQT